MTAIDLVHSSILGTSMEKMKYLQTPSYYLATVGAQCGTFVFSPILLPNLTKQAPGTRRTLSPLTLCWVLTPGLGIGLLEEKTFGPEVGGICILTQADLPTPRGLVAEPGVDIGSQNSHFK